MLSARNSWPSPRIRSAEIGCFHNQIVREECLIHGQRGCPHVNCCPQAELPTGGLKTLSRARRRRTAAGALASADG